MLDRPSTQTFSPCLADPDRWAAGGDDPQLKTMCRACPRRFTCAREALDTPGIEGMIAAVYVPREGRGRTFALRQLQSLSAYAGLAEQPAFPR
ncbi:transcription factor WhiB (plasmid) [Mycolicibacterium aichiense]|uniref:transcription factor WhiB n=1 Tax=Mycolicibacterium aichiense TaxID=1799 RepID=UPI003D66A445